ncbi:MAG TPA: amidohydrolase family protein, partial [Pyrinomonadaceae bacterium]|nr:amidohydrolase family protein [Pyrinomonadaceae bacterium]
MSLRISFRKFSALTLALLLVALSPPASVAQRTRARARAESADLLLVNGKVFTADARHTLAEAVAVRAGRIVAVGTTAELRARYTPARVIDLRGRLVTPGFNDAHLHVLGGGLALMRVDLVGAATLEEAKRRVAESARQLPAGTWIRGRGWDHTLWGGRWPTRQDLDAVAPNHPVILQRVDGHVTWVNTLALQKAGVTAKTQAPEGGELLRDASGEPTGILKETAGNLVGRVVPEPTREENKEA